MDNTCNVCGCNYKYEDGLWVCPACGAIKPEELSSEETTLLVGAGQKMRLSSFCEAEELYTDIIAKFPKSSEAYWGLTLAKYAIKYEVDFDGKTIPSCYNTTMECLLDDEDYQKAVSLAKKEKKAYYIKQAEYIERVRIEWLEKAKKEPQYDIFICYKDSDFANNIERTKDSYEAYEIYTHFKDLGYKVFYSRESLKEKVGQLKYEPYIFNALQTAKVMIVYGSNPDYFASTWLKNEWFRYYKLLKASKKNENSLFVLYDGFNANQLPRPLNSMQCLDANNISVFNILDKAVDKIINESNATFAKIEKKEVKINNKKSKKIDFETVETIELTKKITPKKKATTKAEISKRAIGTYATLSVPASLEAQLKTAQVFLKTSLFEEALMMYNALLENSKNNYAAILGVILSETKCIEIAELPKNGFKNFYHYELINDYIDSAPKVEAKTFIDIVIEYITSNIESDKIEEATRYFNVIADYSYEKISEIDDDILKILISKISVSGEKFDKEIDKYIAIGLGEEKDGVVRSLSSAAVEYLKIGNFEKANKYAKKLLEVDSGNYIALMTSLKCKYYIVFSADLLSMCVTNKSFAELDVILKTIDKDDFPSFLKTVNVYKSGKLKGGEFSKILVCLEFVLKYNFDDREAFVENCLDECIESACEENEQYFSFLLKMLNTDKTELYCKYVFDYAKKAQELGMFDLAIAKYNFLIELGERTSNVLLGKLCSQIRCASIKALNLFITNLKNCDILEAILQEISTVNKREKFLLILAKACIVNETATKNGGALWLFDELLKYFSEDDNADLVKAIFDMAMQLKLEQKFLLAEKYYAICVSLDKDKHEAYWGLLQAKCHCCDDKEMIFVSTPISEFAEFKNAIFAAVDDTLAIEKYVSVKARQQEWNSPEQASTRKNEKKQKMQVKRNHILFTVAYIATAFIPIIMLIVVSCTAQYIGNVASISILITLIVLFIIAIVFNRKNFFDANWVKRTKKKRFIKIVSTAVVVSTCVMSFVFFVLAMTQMGNVNAKGDNYLYNESKGEVTLAQYIGDENITTLIIPDYINEKPVTAIASDCYKDLMRKVQKVVMPKHLKEINEDAFKNFAILKNVELNESLKSVGNSAFKECINLEKITIPVSTMEIGFSAFENCTNLKEVVINGELKKYLAQNIFKGCKKLESVVINQPNEITKIYDGAFENCELLNNFVMPPNLVEIGKSAFSGCGAIQNVILPSSLQIIDSYAFKGCQKLETIFIPKGVSSLGDIPFDNCGSLKVVVEKTADEANLDWGLSWNNAGNLIVFYGYSNCQVEGDYLIATNINNGRNTIIKYLGNEKTLTIPESLGGKKVNAIAKGAFYQIKNLEQVSIPKGIDFVEKGAFNGGTSTLQIFCFDDVQNKDWDSNWYGGNCRCDFGIISRGTTQDGFAYNVTTKNEITITAYFGNVTDIIIPSTIASMSVTTIAKNAFASEDEVASVTVPDSVTVIEDYAFQSCKSLTTFKNSKKLIKMGSSIFRNSYSLTDLWLPKTLEQVGENLVNDKTTISCEGDSQSIKNNKDWNLRWSYNANNVVYNIPCPYGATKASFNQMNIDLGKNAKCYFDVA